MKQPNDTQEILLSDYILSIEKDVFEKKSVSVMRNNKVINNILTIDQFAQLINTASPSTLSLRFSVSTNRYLKYYNGWLKKANTFPYKEILNIDEINSLINSGATLILDNAENISSSIAMITKELIAKFRCNVRASLYYSKQDATSFGAHFDSHDILVAQLHGRKTWKLHKPTYEYPEKGSKDLDFIRPTDKRFSIMETCQCETIYVPMGYWHDVYTNDTSSLHISFIFDFPRVLDVIQEDLKSLFVDSTFRQPVYDSISPEQLSLVKEKMIFFINNLSVKNINLEFNCIDFE